MFHQLPGLSKGKSFTFNAMWAVRLTKSLQMGQYIVLQKIFQAGSSGTSCIVNGKKLENWI